MRLQGDQPVPSSPVAAAGRSAAGAGTVCSDAPLRSVAKAISYRVVGTLVTVTVAWMVTEQLALAAAIGLSDTVIKIFTFYFHERAWERIGFGRRRHPAHEPAEAP